MNRNIIQQELAGTAAEDLFLMMAMKDEPEQVRLGYLEFYRRYADFLREVIHEICTSFNLYKAEIEEVLFDNTINKVVEKADKFIKIEEETNQQHKDNRIKSWLSKVTENELKQIIRKGQNDCLIFDKLDNIEKRKKCDENEDMDQNEPEDFIFDESPPVSRLTPDEVKWFEEAMTILSEQQQYVLNQIYLHKTDSKYLQSEVLEAIAVKLMITKDSVRQIHHRAINKIKQYINSKTLKHEPNGRHTIYERRNL